MVRTTCRTISFSGMSTHSICPLTGRVGNECGEICPAQAPAQFTTTPAANCVLLVRTPHTLPSATSTASTSSPDENSTPRCRAAAMAAAVRCRGSTQRSFTKKPAESFARNAGSNSSSGLGRAEPGPCPVFLLTKISVPTALKSIFSPDSFSSSLTNSGYIPALAVASSRSSGCVSSGKSHNIPPAAHEASRPGSPFSTTSTRSPRLFNSSASASPMMPAPTTIASQFFTPSIVVRHTSRVGACLLADYPAESKPSVFW